MLGNLTGWHFLIILVVILLLFGAPKLPGLARSLGQSMKIFKSEITPDRNGETRPADDTDGSTSAHSSPSTDSRGAPHPKA
ncbi:twin-arginine translocase TatA/TatE family subunit [Cryobacterium sp. TMS1-20-1]|uniref:twin-arginine translocase TatA/TatE family subunit n=1 Tax=unclassified Cryobacterium TaxID=2649013 RepID=UPI001068DE95|nr:MULTISPECIES: twin-arginine translocase TatA/TatE family subunit [unclassified Cryobacterium]TFC80146.1 twin-arginine translocase TatA/TatE family subunit [Cryobacterium sp. TMS1-20-1]TFD54138.1 twin-arginine translocase TatA/TatE family subunit [Cryobacterium sp. Hh11]